MNALDKLLADIRRAHHGEPLKPAPCRKTTACPQGQAPQAQEPAVPATITADNSPAITRALDVLRAAMRAAS